MKFLIGFCAAFCILNFVTANPISTEEEDNELIIELNNNLYEAAENGDLSAVKEFLEQGADVNYHQENLGETPIHIATQNGHFDIVKFLIERGSEVSGKDIYNETPLHYAANSNHLHIVQLLLENGSEVNAKDEFGMTPLALAKAKFYHSIVEVLTNAGGR